jgi:hypothetical protein
MARRHEKRSIWPKLLGLIILCLLAGAVFSWFQGAGSHSAQRLPRRGPEPTAAQREQPVPAAAQSPARPEKTPGKSREEQLEREVKRLNDVIQAKNREISDMKIRLKLMNEGSHTAK